MAKAKAEAKAEATEVAMDKKYVAIAHFFDEQDAKKTVYKVGDAFPKTANKKISDSRLTEMLTANNNLKKPVIKEVK